MVKTPKNEAMESRISSFADYLASQPSRSRVVLRQIRVLVKTMVPDAEETISYQLPAFKRGRVFIDFAGFKNHVGIYPPVRDDTTLVRALTQHRNEKGNLRSSLDEPLPVALDQSAGEAVFEGTRPGAYQRKSSGLTRDQRISGFQLAKAGEVLVNTPQFPHTMVDAQGCNTAIVHARSRDF
jgi:uncharacterized protein YdhG (YjbR/CyaY superfamily)